MDHEREILIVRVFLRYLRGSLQSLGRLGQRCLGIIITNYLVKLMTSGDRDAEEADEDHQLTTCFLRL